MTAHNDTKKRLNELQAELETRIQKIKADIAHSGRPPENNSKELAIEAENDQVLDALMLAAQQEIEQIKQALQRIEQDRYGRCTQCDQEISSARLKALPFATHCIGCS